MKKNKSLIIAFILLICLTACGSKNVELNKPVEKGVGRITVLDVELVDTKYLNGNKYSSDFLKPIMKDDLQTGDNFIKSLKDDVGVVVVTINAENIGKSGWIVHAFDYVINYDKGNKYGAESLYAQTKGNGWSGFEEVTLEKVTSGIAEIKIPIWIPSIAINDNTKSLTLEFYGFTYEIR